MKNPLQANTYQVLARSWRPKNFVEVLGQEHVIRPLSNALTQKRLHHAYLFSGTRGVGKTTIARILAKCFNCETGITATPCGKCDACLEIDSGKFIDLIEVDAASRTKVEDTRELLDNVQYLPTKGRHKVYLIDEVHMLSGHSFNALLKTLEEPPEHIKFLLATTDPQKLPITVLSRCLQFNLKSLAPNLIQNQLQIILNAEKIPYEEDALRQLSYAAKGSMRDALSLLDQAIAFGENRVDIANVKIMLGSIDADKILLLLEELVAGNSAKVLAIANDLGELAVDFLELTDQLLEVLYQISLLQLIPQLDTSNWQAATTLQKLTTQISAEETQLYYQIALIGKRDLALAPNTQIGFEMLLLRMLAFRPENISPLSLKTSGENQNINANTEPPVNKLFHSKPTEDSRDADLLTKLNMNGPTGALLQHCVVGNVKGNEIEILLDPSQAALLHEKHEERISLALSKCYNEPMTAILKLGTASIKTPAKNKQQEKQKIQDKAWQELQKDANMQKLINTFDAKIITNSPHIEES